MIKPISPKDIVSEKAKTLPDEVMQSFNELIASNWDGSQSLIYQEDVIHLIATKMNLNTVKPLDTNWLNIEPIYQEAGWTVKYEKPDYTETGRAFFIFSK